MGLAGLFVGWKEREAMRDKKYFDTPWDGEQLSDGMPSRPRSFSEGKKFTCIASVAAKTGKGDVACSRAMRWRHDRDVRDTSNTTWGISCTHVTDFRRHLISSLSSYYSPDWMSAETE